jgi:hypothetical protein
VPREVIVKVTLSLSRRSLDFFKREAKMRRVSYQRMIRAPVDTMRKSRRAENRRVGKGANAPCLRGSRAASRETALWGCERARVRTLRFAHSTLAIYSGDRRHPGLDVL